MPIPACPHLVQEAVHALHGIVETWPLSKEIESLEALGPKS